VETCAKNGLPGSVTPITACSACAGDYENPDATAPPLDGEDHEEVLGPDAPACDASDLTREAGNGVAPE